MRSFTFLFYVFIFQTIFLSPHLFSLCRFFVCSLMPKLQQPKVTTVVELPSAISSSSSSCNYSVSSTGNEPTVTQDQLSEKPTDEEVGHQLTKTSTVRSVKKTVTTIFDKPIFSGTLLILSGISIAFQAGRRWFPIKLVDMLILLSIRM